MNNLTVIQNKLSVVEDTDNLILTDKKFNLNSAIASFQKGFLTLEKTKLQIMFLVCKCYDYKIYEQDEETKSFSEFTKKYFDMSKSSTSELLKVARRFGAYEFDDNEGKYKPLYKLSEDFNDFNFSQLLAMSPLDDETIITYFQPEWTVSKIKSEVEFYQNSIESVPLEELGVDMNPPEEISEEQAPEENSSEKTSKDKEIYGVIPLDDLMDKKFKLEGNSKGYVLELDKDDNLVIKVII